MIFFVGILIVSAITYALIELEAKLNDEHR